MSRVFPLGMMIAVLAVSACETMQGAGRDMQTAGQALTQQAQTSQVQMGQPSYAGAAPVAPAPY